MPLTRYRIKNEYGLADPEMYRSADKDDPEALLEGVAMAGLVGLLRQLGDLAEFAAEIFHDLHEEVMATAARGHGLMVRIQQLEAEFPPIEKALLLQTNHSLYYANAGVDWHPNMQMEQNLIARGDLPRFIMDSYEESRGPPRLFLLDKFDVAGAGACLKRYTDPSFFKVETLSDGLPAIEKKARKSKRKGSRWRNGETPETVPASHAKLHQLFMEERIENAYNDPSRRVKLKKRPLHGSPFDTKSGKSYMEKFAESPSPESKTIWEVPVIPLSLKWTQDDPSESGHEVVEVSTISPAKDMSQENGREASSPDIREKQFMDDLEGFQPAISGETDEVSFTSQAAVEEKELMVNEDGNGEGSTDGYDSDEIISEVENYMDALATIESEMETDSESRLGHDNSLLSVGRGGRDCNVNEDMELQRESLGSHSVGKSASYDGNSSFGRSSSSVCVDGTSNMGDSTPLDTDSFSKVIAPPESTSRDSGNVQDITVLPPNEETIGVESKELMVCTPAGTKDDSEFNRRDSSQASSSVESESKWMPLNAGAGSNVVSEQEEMSSDHIKDATGLSVYDETSGYLNDSAALASDDVPDLATISTKSLPAEDLEGGQFNVSMDREHLSNSLNLTLESERANEVRNAVDAAESYGEIQSRMDSPESKSSLEGQHHIPPHAEENESDDHSISSASLLQVSDDEQASETDDEVEYPTLATADDRDKSIVSEEEPTIHVEEQNEGDVAVNEGNLSYMALQHKGGDYELSRTRDGENIDSYIYNEASLEESGDPIHLDISEARNDVCSNSGDSPLARVILEEKTCIVGEAHNLVDGQLFLVETEEVTLHEQNLLEEECHGQVTRDGENTDTLTCNVVAVGETTVTLAPSVGDYSLSDDLAALEVRAEGEGNSQASAADVWAMPQESVDFYAAELHCSMKESGVEEKVNEVGVARTDVGSAPAADWDSVSHDGGSTEVGFSGSSPPDPAQTVFLYDEKTPLTDLEEALFSRSSWLVASTPASEEPLRLLDDESAVHLHLVDDEKSESSRVQAEQVPSPDLFDQETIVLPKSEAAPDDLVEEGADSNEFQQVEAAQLPGCQNEEPESPKSLNQCKEDGSFSEELLDNLSIQQPGPSVTDSVQRTVLGTEFHNAGHLSEDREVNSSEMPPLPLPPVQWRMGKAPNFQSIPESKVPEFGFHLFPPLPQPVPEATPQIGFPPFGLGNPASHNPFLSPTDSEIENQVHPYPQALQLPPVNIDSVDHSNGIEEKSLQEPLQPDARFGEPSEQYFLATDTYPIQHSPVPQPASEDNSKQHSGSLAEELALTVDKSESKTGKKVEDLQHNSENVDQKDSSERTNTLQEQHTQLKSENERAGSAEPWAVDPANEGGKPNGTLMGNIPRPPKPLIAAVAAHDRSRLRKVAERVRPQLAPKLEERDSLLQQIRTKSFSLKPTTVSRPSIQQGPRTNLKVAAILQKANAIRQATAGSDEDDDSDSWSE